MLRNRTILDDAQPSLLCPEIRAWEALPAMRQAGAVRDKTRLGLGVGLCRESLLKIAATPMPNASRAAPPRSKGRLNCAHSATEPGSNRSEKETNRAKQGSCGCRLCRGVDD